MVNNSAFESKKIESSVAALLNDAAKELAHFLETLLPSLFDDWWKDAVTSNLSYQQQRRLEQSRTNSLASLDLAALIRVLDRNWYQVSIKLNLPAESRHFIKEMHTVRNRWAHANTGGVPFEDMYRDLDTLQRFASIINANEILLNEVRALKTSLITTELHGANRGKTVEPKDSQVTKGEDAEFKPGQIVVLKSNPSIKGAVVSIVRGGPETRVKVFTGGDTQTYYASQLQAEDQRDENTQFVAL